MTSICKYLKKMPNGNYYYFRRTPQSISAELNSQIFKKSLKTKDLDTAIVRYNSLHDIVEQEWMRLAMEGSDEKALKMYNIGINRAQSLNLNYLTKSQLLKEDQFEELLQRVTLLSDINSNDENISSRSVLGVNTKPKQTISQALDLYFNEIAKQEQNGISENQLRVWRNPRKRAVSNFIKLNGDIAMDTIERRHAIRLRQMWLDRITGKNGESAKPSTAKKDFGYLAVLYKEYFSHTGDIDKQNPFDKITFKNMDNDKGVPYPTSLVKQMMNDSIFKNLNFEARMVLFAFADTGARPSELCGLDKEDIILDSLTPHIIIKDKPHRRLKNRSSNRTIPLIGVALEAFKAYPKGFEKYKFNETNLSATLNKFLKSNGYKPSPKHSLYSLRHAFIDRMEEAGLEEEFRHRILGHTLKTQEYGEGGSLEFRRSQLLKVQQPYDTSLFNPKS